MMEINIIADLLWLYFTYTVLFGGHSNLKRERERVLGGESYYYLNFTD
jgi:hypothetical protein